MSITRCPHCNGSIELRAAGVGPRLVSRRGSPVTFESSIPPWEQSIAADAPVSPVSDKYRVRTPTGLPTVEVVKVEFFRSVIAGGFTLILAIPATISFEWAWYTPIITAPSVAAFAWLIQVVVDSGLLWKVEEWTRLDIDGDGEKGKPAKVEIEARVVNTETGQHVIGTIILPAHKLGAYITFAQAIINGKARFNEQDAGRCGLSQAEFNAIRDEYFRHGWAKWKNPNWHKSGIIILKDGWNQLAETARTPLP